MHPILIHTHSYCQATGVVATQPSLTCTSRAVRAETIPIFYQENIFQHPLAHPGTPSVRGWLNSIGAENRSLLRHLELTFLNTERAISSLDVHYQMRPAKESVVVENVMWDDGQMGEMEWHVFTALNTVTASRVTDEDAKSIETSLLFELGEVNYDANLLGLDAGASEDDWETREPLASHHEGFLHQRHLRRSSSCARTARHSATRDGRSPATSTTTCCGGSRHVSHRIQVYLIKLTLCSEPRPIREEA